MASGLGAGTPPDAGRARVDAAGISPAALTDLHVFPERLGRPSDVAAVTENERRGGGVVRLDAAPRL